MIGSGGEDGSVGAIFSRELLLHRKAMSLQVGGEFQGEDGSDISDGSDGVFFPGTPFTSQSDVPTSGWRVPGGGRGLFPEEGRSWRRLEERD